MNFQELLEIVKNHYCLFDGNSATINVVDNTIEVEDGDFFDFNEHNVTNIRVIENRIVFDSNYNSDYDETFSFQPMIKLDVLNYLKK